MANDHVSAGKGSGVLVLVLFALLTVAALAPAARWRARPSTEAAIATTHVSAKRCLRADGAPLSAPSIGDKYHTKAYRFGCFGPDGSYMSGSNCYAQVMDIAKGTLIPSAQVSCKSVKAKVTRCDYAPDSPGGAPQFCEFTLAASVDTLTTMRCLMNNLESGKSTPASIVWRGWPDMIGVVDATGKLKPPPGPSLSIEVVPDIECQKVDILESGLWAYAQPYTVQTASSAPASEAASVSGLGGLSSSTSASVSSTAASKIGGTAARKKVKKVRKVRKHAIKKKVKSSASASSSSRSSSWASSAR